jgi:hypothetical protein
MNTDTNPRYEVRVVGHLDSHWSPWLCDLALHHHDDGTSTLTGSVVDQAQLYGVLARLRDIGAQLLSVRLLDDDERSSGPPSLLPTGGGVTRPG